MDTACLEGLGMTKICMAHNAPTKNIMPQMQPNLASLVSQIDILFILIWAGGVAGDVSLKSVTTQTSPYPV